MGLLPRKAPDAYVCRECVSPPLRTAVVAYHLVLIPSLQYKTLTTPPPFFFLPPRAVHKFLTVHKDSSIIVAPRTNEAIFTIKHYAGDVVYTGDTFLEKNRDRSARLLWPLVLVSYTPTNVNKLSHPDVFCRISLFPLPSSPFSHLFNLRWHARARTNAAAALVPW